MFCILSTVTDESSVTENPVNTTNMNVTQQTGNTVPFYII